MSKISTNQKFKDFIIERTSQHFNQALLQAKNSANRFTKIFWIHIASAGELEQAIPILRYLNQNENIGFFVTYFSPSAKPFLKNVPGLLHATALPVDAISPFVKLIETLQICQILFVRYDIWPGILLAANKKKIEVSLLAASKARAHKSLFQQIGLDSRRLYIPYFSNIFTVKDEDVLFFKKLAPQANVVCSGDPKWGRAKERVSLLKKTSLGEKLGLFSNICFVQRIQLKKMCYVFGSPHKEEHDIAVRCARLENSFVIYVPDNLTSENLIRIQNDFLSAGLTTVTLTDLEKELDSLNSSNETPVTQKNMKISENLFSEKMELNPKIIQKAKVVILDKMGILAEIYALADIAVIGGGFDGQIHNTLEAAAHPVPVVFGANYSRAPEAQTLIRQKAAKCFKDPHEMFEFLRQCSTLRTAQPEFPDRNAELATMRLNALEVFEKVPNTNAVVFGYLTGK